MYLLPVGLKKNAQSTTLALSSEDDIAAMPEKRSEMLWIIRGVRPPTNAQSISAIIDFEQTQKEVH